MPCRGPDPTPEDYERSAKAVAKHEKEIKDKIDNLTRMLCNAGKILRYQDVELHSPYVDKKQATELKNWWKEHEDWDKNRLEAAKKSALAKLTDDEKEALGL